MIDWTPTLPESGKPRYILIADAIAQDIRAGTLKPGDRLPPQRKLAGRLGVDFTTVSRAYAEAQSRGLLDSHVGRGTFVTASANGSTAPDPARAGEEDLSMNMPPEPTDPALLEKMREGLSYVGANLVSLLRYQSPIGSEKDKEAASTWLSMRGMVPRLERIAVTPGAHATMTAVLSTLCGAGDAVLCERITYPGLRNIARRLGIELVGLEMDESGILPDALEAAIRAHGPRALYLNPTLQNPTTLTMPTARRLEVSEVLNRHGLPLIEDDAYGFIPARAPAPLAVSAPDLTWHIGGLAKCIGAGLRLAYVVAPSARGAFNLAQALRATAVMPSPISAALATHWIEDGTAERIRRFIRTESAARQAIAAETLEGLKFTSDPNAFNIWLHLPKGSGRADLMGRMAGRHVGLMPSDVFTVSGAPDEHVRVCLGGSITREELQRGLLFMANSLQQEAWMG
ncbi:PLP-dependent aminotransferase family protein [Oceanicella sp. SM1341]|uniref:aminotransferase-like domain-containing protein n=1 Tax=Oceanicella sp. SM1341 TaxID=1548889 RepID=UPI000E4977CC|nr:PLP-dependent aminotransferase family protein [Oceanicella sp. SM1341]